MRILVLCYKNNNDNQTSLIKEYKFIYSKVYPFKFAYHGSMFISTAITYIRQENL
jgi:hypothetical protein